MSQILSTADTLHRRSGRSGVTLRSIGVATPAHSRPQEEIANVLERAWGLRGAEAARWRRIVAGSGIDQRQAVGDVEEILRLSTAERMVLFARHAPALAAEAARHAMERAGVAPDEITDLVIVTCTGFASPGVDVALIDELGLGRHVHRCQVGFMGCFGAITGLRAAMGAAALNPGAVVLLVCVELCSLHLRNDRHPQNLVASALFGDGAAAAVVTGREVADEGRPSMGYGELGVGRSLLMPEGRGDMTWTITDEGFAMTLSRTVPASVQAALKRMASEHITSAAIHPGGPNIIDAVEQALELPRSSGDASRAVLRRHGNMSSPSVLFVVQELRERGEQPQLLTAFGPGLTVETLDLAPGEPSS